jgi:hypothetical protein
MKPIDILIPDEFRVYFEQNDGVVKYPDPLLRKVAKPDSAHHARPGASD